ncbi:hypothetical protein PilKf_00295 [Pillotina sp. SPG140]|jgi:hypothetical protein
MLKLSSLIMEVLQSRQVIAVTVFCILYIALVGYVAKLRIIKRKVRASKKKAPRPAPPPKRTNPNEETEELVE